MSPVILFLVGNRLIGDLVPDDPGNYIGVLVFFYRPSKKGAATGAKFFS